MKKSTNLEYFLSLQYKTEVERIPEEEGGGYTALHPELGIRGYGDSMEEAVEDLEEIKRACLEDWLAEGLQIPEPEDVEPLPSGKLVLRLPKSLHRALKYGARHEGVSLNKHIVNLLIKATSEKQSIALFDDAIKQITAVNWKMLQDNRNVIAETLGEMTHQYQCPDFKNDTSDLEDPVSNYKAGIA